ARSRRPGCLGKIARHARAESNDHADLGSRLWSSAGGCATPCVEIRDQNRHHEHENNPLADKKWIARFLQEQSLLLHGLIEWAQPRLNEEGPCIPNHATANAPEPHPSGIQLHCAPYLCLA